VDYTLFQIVVILCIGLTAGVLGGMLGIGGSIIMIPALAILFHSADPESQHLYQASAMAVNVAVLLPAALRHRKAGVIRRDLFVVLLPAAAVAIVLGVMVSNQVSGQMLRRLFAIFLAYAAFSDLLSMFRKAPEHAPDLARVTPLRSATIGGVMGGAAGVLGIGGGVVGIPLMRVLCRLPLRQCIGASSAVMCMTAVVGASLKIGTLEQHGYAPIDAVKLAALLVPTAIVGGRLGAGLTHKLPLDVIRVALIVLLLLASWRMASL